MRVTSTRNKVKPFFGSVHSVPENDNGKQMFGKLRRYNVYRLKQDAVYESFSDAVRHVEVSPP